MKKKHQRMIRLACQILDGEVVDKVELDPPTFYQKWLWQLVDPDKIPREWIIPSNPSPPTPGDCENCRHAVHWPEDAHNEYLARIRRHKAGALFCCHDARKPRRASRVRGRCPLKKEGGHYA